MILFNKIYFTQYVNISNYDKIIIGLYKVKGPQPLLCQQRLWTFYFILPPLFSTILHCIVWLYCKYFPVSGSSRLSSLQNAREIVAFCWCSTSSNNNLATTYSIVAKVGMSTNNITKITKNIATLSLWRKRPNQVADNKYSDESSGKSRKLRLRGLTNKGWSDHTSIIFIKIRSEVYLSPHKLRSSFENMFTTKTELFKIGEWSWQ